MPKFNIEFSFSMTARAYGYSIEAADEDEARRKAEEAIVNGDLDIAKFEDSGGDASQATWSTKGGCDFDYEVDEVERGEDEEEDEETAEGPSSGIAEAMADVETEAP